MTNSLSTAFISYLQCKLILERLDDIITETIEETGNHLIKKEISGNIRLENVCFSYTKHSKEVLKNINLKIKAGNKVAIVGNSGSGKTTLAKVLVGLYSPTKGNIFIDDINFDELDKEFVRKQMGIVPQDVFLFNRTILENIVINDEGVALEKVKKACSLAQINEEIESMLMGYNTIISEYGQNISGGQRQRILLARAILNNPKILLFDEATSSLDNINENKISRFLEKLGCTKIIIAHRLSTIINSDIIVVMENGEIVSLGKHEELLINCKCYSNLYNNSDSCIS